ncbi:hypothetical protein ACH4PU_30910 [Streptomyces sp. NPDC021100]|uniref:hypothetical protein n=1 Tax=Streptomyces sp. NPDC021100 TaxID=3365114 RepID=UPI0037A971A4
MSDDEGGPDEELGEDGVGAELCDLCGAVITDDSELYALVPDSSVIHSEDAKFDGKRFLTACSREHLAELVEQYKQRPFVEEELWAGKIGRAIEQHGGRVSAEELMAETGLDQSQIDRAVQWQNEEALRWRQRFGGGDEPED